MLLSMGDTHRRPSMLLVFNATDRLISRRSVELEFVLAQFVSHLDCPWQTFVSSWIGQHTITCIFMYAKPHRVHLSSGPTPSWRVGLQFSLPKFSSFSFRGWHVFIFFFRTFILSSDNQIHIVFCSCSIELGGDGIIIAYTTNYNRNYTLNHNTNFSVYFVFFTNSIRDCCCFACAFLARATKLPRIYGNKFQCSIATIETVLLR